MTETPVSSAEPSGSSTPANNTSNNRFTSQNQTAEDVLKEQTVGLVHLSDFRKRRAEALEQVSRDVTPGAQGSGASTPDRREPSTDNRVTFKKRKKAVKKGGLSFNNDEEEEESNITKRSNEDKSTPPAEEGFKKKRSLKPNTTLSAPAPKALTKSALLRDTQLKESLRKEYLQIQEAVRATEFCLTFVFFDGKDAPGGVCRMKKGDAVWLFLDRARKVGATASGGARKDWARIGVDDLMLVRGELIIGHHYDFHHFILNQTTGYNSMPLFPFSAEPTPTTPANLLPQKSSSASPSGTPEPTSHLTTSADRAASKAAAAISLPADSELEGFDSDPSLTKVVDRRWYERNKHIYPASLWEDFDPNKDYSTGGRKDGLGNAFFFSR